MAGFDRGHFFSSIRSLAKKLQLRRRRSSSSKSRRNSTSSSPDSSTLGSNHSTASSASSTTARSNDIRRVFAEYDRDADGRISLADLTSMVTAVGSGSKQTAADEARAMMEVADLDGDGYIGFQDFETLMTSSGASRSGDAAGCHGNDDNPDNLQQGGQPSFCNHQDHERGCMAGDDKDLRLAFAVYDRDGDGVITAQEIHAVLCRVMETATITLADCRDMVRAVDRDGDGVVGFHDFAAMMMA